MAAYAALTSLMQILDQLDRHPSPPLTLDRQQVQSLTEIVTSLQEFLESYNSPFSYSDEADPLEMRIADAAYKAEDVIESEIVGRIRSSCKSSPHGDDFYQDVQGVVQEMDLIKKEVMEIMRSKKAAVHQEMDLINNNEELEIVRDKVANILRSSSLTGKNNIMVGFDDVLLQLLDKLTRGPLYRKVIPIAGMGGIGKTTLARNIFENAFIKEYFDVCAWVTISQQFSIKDIISQVLSQVSGKLQRDESEEDLGEELYKYLFGRRYLIVMDDIWSIDVWEKMRFVLGDSNSGSRVIVTTRQSYLTSQLSGSDHDHGHDMRFLDEVNSWNLFSKTVFGDEGCFPLPLEKIGKKIVERCRGLPLSIVVIGGLLAKSEHTQECWSI